MKRKDKIIPTNATVNEHQQFIDATAIALFARGWPLNTIWTQAERLWASRRAHLEAEAYGAGANPAASAAKTASGTADGDGS